MRQVLIASVAFCILALSGVGIATATPLKGGASTNETPLAAELRCNATTITVSEPLSCHYDAGGTASEPVASLSAKAGVATITSLGGSVACSPDGACVYWISGNFTVRFVKPGNKVVSVTACAAGDCVRRDLNVRVTTNR
ncbi:MAG: hypothetical protein ABIP58_05345 [Dehalococcoidia bacterium]